MALIRRLGREIGLLGGDVMEVAPPLAHGDGEPERTLALAVRYLKETAAAVLGEQIRRSGPELSAPGRRAAELN